MIEVLKAISETSVPSLLMGLGGVLLLLAFVQKIGTQIELPESRQRVAAIVGALLLALGTGVAVVPHLARPPAIAGSSGNGYGGFGPVSEARGPESPALVTNALSPLDPREKPGVPAEVAAQDSADAEPQFDGTLGSLMPDLSLLPSDMKFFDSRELTIASKLEDTRSDKTAARRILTKGGYSGIEQKYDAFCGSTIPDGEVRHAIFRVERFKDAASAAAWFDLPPASQSPTVVSSGAWHPRLDSWVGDIVTTCGSASATLHWRSLRVGNVLLTAGLFTSRNGVGEPDIAFLSEELVRSMAEKINGAEI